MQHFVDQRQHAFEITIDIVVPKTQDPKPLFGEVVVSFGVTPRMRIEVMLTAINLDDEAVSEADEVNDEIVTRRLAAEMEAARPPGSEMNPQLDFLRRHSLAQISCDLVRHAPTRPPLRSATLPLRGRD